MICVLNVKREVFCVLYLNQRVDDKVFVHEIGVKCLV